MRIEMQPKERLTLGLAFTGLLGLAFLGVTHVNPASAQDPANGPRPGGGRMMGGMGTVAASGDYVYVLQAGTLYQMKAADLSVVKSQPLPAPGAPGAAAPPANP